jgi:RNA polymerase sigma-70 factor (ECF subfamily)
LTVDGGEIDRLLSRVALGDRQAFSRLYDLAAPKLFAICMRILRDRVQAEDALQEVCVKIWRSAGAYAGGSQSPMGWLVAIARNQAIDAVRARRAPAVDIDEALAVADSGPDPEQSAVTSDEGRRLGDCLGQQKPERAEALRAAYIEGYSYEELAKRFSVPLNTMRTWLRRGLISLRECLEGQP